MAIYLHFSIFLSNFAHGIINFNKQTIMKKILFAALLAMTAITASAQQYTSKEFKAKQDTAFVNKAMSIDPHQFKAGEFLRESANYDAGAWALAAVSGIFYSGLITGDDRSMANTVGTACAVGAVVCKVLAIRYKWKSGVELQMSAGNLRVTF